MAEPSSFKYKLQIQPRPILLPHISTTQHCQVPKVLGQPIELVHWREIRVTSPIKTWSPLEVWCLSTLLGCLRRVLSRSLQCRAGGIPLNPYMQDRSSLMCTLSLTPRGESNIRNCMPAPAIVCGDSTWRPRDVRLCRLRRPCGISPSNTFCSMVNSAERGMVYGGLAWVDMECSLSRSDTSQPSKHSS